MVGRLRGQGLDIRIPDESGRKTVHDIIYNELVHGKVKTGSRQAYQNIIGQMVADNAEGVILGCTEIGLLIKQTHSPVPVFDTTRIHATAAVEWALMG